MRPEAKHREPSTGSTLMKEWEKIVPGTTVRYGSETVTKEEIIAFAREFDPQPFHLDDSAGVQRGFGGIIASGWHTASLSMKMITEHALDDSTSMGSPGVRELRWLAPVRPGDALSMRQTILNKRLSRSMPGVGLVESTFEIVNQHDTVVLRYTSTGMFRVPADQESREAPG